VVDGGHLILESRIPLLRKGLLASQEGWSMVDGRWWSLDPRVSHPLATQGFATSPGWMVDGGHLILESRTSLLRKGSLSSQEGWSVVVGGGRWWFGPRVSHPLATQGFATSPGWMVDGGRWWSMVVT
jgi:hypothetical protein